MTCLVLMSIVKNISVTCTSLPCGVGHQGLVVLWRIHHHHDMSSINVYCGVTSLPCVVGHQGSPGGGSPDCPH